MTGRHPGLPRDAAVAQASPYNQGSHAPPPKFVFLHVRHGFCTEAPGGCPMVHNTPRRWGLAGRAGPAVVPAPWDELGPP